MNAMSCLPHCDVVSSCFTLIIGAPLTTLWLCLR